jgi:hypothetical protein
MECNKTFVHGLLTSASVSELEQQVQEAKSMVAAAESAGERRSMDMVRLLDRKLHILNGPWVAAKKVESAALYRLGNFLPNYRNSRCHEEMKKMVGSSQWLLFSSSLR